MTQVTLSSDQAEKLEALGSQARSSLGTGYQAPTSPRRLRWLTDPTSAYPVYIGVASTVIGFILIFIAWGDTAGTAAEYLQIPYLISGGFTGLALVMAGLVIVNIGVRRQDGAERARQMSTLTEALGDLQRSLRP